ncbi:MAG TPA: hypothetical protein VGE98_15925 [Thermoanaerobaculia bacterium]
MSETKSIQKGTDPATQPDAQQMAMTLSGIAYAPGGDVQKYLGSSEYDASAWTLAWGPASSVDNMAYGAWSETLKTYALVIRGADPCDVREIFDVCNQVPWEYPPTAGASISAGANEALNDVLGLQAADGTTLLDWISNAVLPNPASLWVTGHSLGGCIASMLAAYLVNWLAGQNVAQAVQAYTFAAPTVGNAAFAQLAAQAPQIPNRVYNTLDVVPLAFGDLQGMKTIYEPTYECPDWLQRWIERVTDCLGSYTFVQPPWVEYSLAGTAKGSDYVSEALAQHHHNTYLTLLKAKILPF